MVLMGVGWGVGQQTLEDRASLLEMRPVSLLRGRKSDVCAARGLRA